MRTMDVSASFLHRQSNDFLIICSINTNFINYSLAQDYYNYLTIIILMVILIVVIVSQKGDS